MMNQALVTPLLGATVFLIAGSVAYCATAVFTRIGYKTGMLDIPSGRKSHAKPTPFLGGASLFLAFWTVVGAGMLLCKWVSLHPNVSVIPYLNPFLISMVPLTKEIGPIFLGALVIFMLGLLDDVYNLSPLVKLAGQSVSAILLISIGYTINFVQELGVLGYIITLLWVLLVINAFNFIDSIDGHCSGIALISCMTFVSISLILNQPVIAVFSLVFAGTLAGFLPHNFKPAKIFLGDCGSLLIGYTMAALTLLCSYQITQQSVLTRYIPILMFGVPIYDTVSVVAVRLMRGTAPWKGDRNHFAHRLCRMGMSDKAAVIFSYFVAMTLGLIAILSTQISTPLGSLVLLILFAAIIVIIALLEYYSSLRTRVIEDLQKQHRRRIDDIRNEEDQRI